MGFEAKFDDCTVVLEPLTTNTFILIVAADPRVGESIVRCLRMTSQTFADIPQRSRCCNITSTTRSRTWPILPVGRCWTASASEFVRSHTERSF